MATVKQVVELVDVSLKSLESGTRTDGSKYIYFADNSPEWVNTLVREAHNDGGRLPSDSIFELVKDVFNAISDGAANYEDDNDAQSSLEDIPSDGYLEADIYNSDLMRWLADGNEEYVERALDEYGWESGGNFFSLLQQAQGVQLEEIFQNALRALIDVADELEQEEESEDEIGA